MLLTEFLDMCHGNKMIGCLYPFYLLDSADNYYLTQYKAVLQKSFYPGDFYKIINRLMLEMVDDLLELLSKTGIIDKKRVSMLLKSLHNLPRCYLSENADTLFNLELPHISCEDAVSYSFNYLDESLKKKYNSIVAETI